eukprot:Plantae.Rhodophyta-Rhodochaete_pulchella.ctg19402.p1 GENE.Plantae.Rhodophyta-Rhodochaete_pulchella.ctg19402~~Plantae.Rhodophyta-Rhodochaete_pulchella.ctg19402.p1  ORF type:complete len:183 (-),score=4.89 Plantae.Rhodophyta-Rhodochaete_pulchella.ctg19402:640-1188(-)
MNEKRMRRPDLSRPLPAGWVYHSALQWRRDEAPQACICSLGSSGACSRRLGVRDGGRPRSRLMRRQQAGEESSVPDSMPNYIEIANTPGDADCVQCRADGWITCPVCEGKGFYTTQIMETVSSSMCRMCGGKKTIPCPSCKTALFQSAVWWDLIPDEDEDPDEKWREDEDGNMRYRWNYPPA